MQGYITYVGSSSIEVAIDIVQMCEGGLICDEQKVLAKTNFIMVARDGNKSLKVPGLLLANQQARDIFESGAERAKNRRVRAQQSLSVSPPRAEEVDLIHNLMLRGVGGAGVGVGGVGVGVGIGVGVEGQSMASTVFKSSQLMQSQNRNVHGKIFGGYIMRKSFEIAYVSVTLFCREDYPQLMFVDDIQFLKPINVGSVAEFSATVTYSRDSHVVVRVVAVTIDPISGLKVKTNVLNLIFKSKEPHPPTRNPTPNTGTSPTIPTTVYTIAADPMNTAADPKGSVQVGYVTHKVLPSTYDEVMLYLEGKRSLDAFLGNSCGKGRCAI
ncbi:hypothetical protein B484DRAFT_478960 [Ochromonadaceae sp. CCMP2298]|nr:hypothetical protein B484DRAFT_478960 [Ochromonadaceae sp. CCMP2298]